MGFCIREPATELHASQLVVLQPRPSRAIGWSEGAEPLSGTSRGPELRTADPISNHMTGTGRSE